MFSKLKAKSVEEIEFPRTAKNSGDSVGTVNHIGAEAIHEIVQKLLASEEFVKQLRDELAEVILKRLSEEYGFEPSNKYKEAILEKKAYINQLDNYLTERSQINESLDHDLRQFLATTSQALAKSLEGFTVNLHEKILQLEKKHGVHKVLDVVKLDRIEGE